MRKTDDSSKVTTNVAMNDTTKLVDVVRVAVAGGEATRLVSAAAVLFEAGGKRVLSEGTQAAVRGVATRTAKRALVAMTGPLARGAEALAPAAEAAATSVEARSAIVATRAVSAAGAVTKRAASLAGRQVLRGAGKAAGIGFVIDGVVAGVEAAIRYKRGEIDQAEAVRHVAVEATTGAVATGAGVLIGAGLIALTGGAAAPAVFAVSAIGAIGVKRAARKAVANRTARKLAEEL